MHRLIAMIASLAFVAVPLRGDELQARIDAAAPGDTIEVRPGIHRGTITVKKPLKLIGRG